MLLGGLCSQALAKLGLADSESQACGSALFCLLCLFLEVISGCVSAAGPEVRGRRRDGGRKRQITFQGTGTRSSSYQIFISHTAPEALLGLPLQMLRVCVHACVCARAPHSFVHIWPLAHLLNSCAKLLNIWRCVLNS